MILRGWGVNGDRRFEGSDDDRRRRATAVGYSFPTRHGGVLRPTTQSPERNEGLLMAKRLPPITCYADAFVDGAVLSASVQRYRDLKLLMEGAPLRYARVAESAGRAPASGRVA